MVRLAYGTNVCDSVWFYFRFVPIELIQIKWKTFIHEQALASMEGQMNWILVHKTTSHHLNEKLTSVNTTETETHTQRERERLCVYFSFSFISFYFSPWHFFCFLFLFCISKTIVLHISFWKCESYLFHWHPHSLTPFESYARKIVLCHKSNEVKAGGVKLILELVKTQRANFNRPTNLSTHSSNGQQGKRERQIQLK